MFSGHLKNQLLFRLLLLLVSRELLVLGQEVPPSETTLIFYFGPNYNNSARYQLSDAADIVKNPHFDKPKTHIYLHGFGESQDSESIHVIVDAYLKRKDINLITVDWAKAAGANYFDAAFHNIEVLAPVLADAILNLYKAGIDRKNLEVVAHSLGAQLAGMTGRQVILKTTGRKIYRMAVLDAALPLFFPPFLPTVNQNDAEHLQTIHTDIGTYGQITPLGHVDFWPNGGRQGQPGCPQPPIIPLSPQDLCSHQRSWRFWAESVANANGTEPKFLGFPAQSYARFLTAGKGNLKNKPIEMGINCPLNAKGSYYLRTNSQPLFARGIDGY